MISLIVSSPSFVEGAGEIARGAAARLGGRLLAADVYADAAALAGAEVARLRRALEEPPAFLGLALPERRRLAGAWKAVLAGRLLEGAVVYHGPYGHALFRGIPHLVHASMGSSVMSVGREIRTSAYRRREP